MDGPGRPSLYKPEFAAQAFELCLAGATNRDLADTFDVGHSTIDNWLLKHPEAAHRATRRRSPGPRSSGCAPAVRSNGAKVPSRRRTRDRTGEPWTRRPSG